MNEAITVKRMTVGRKKVTITRSGNKFDLNVDGSKLDTFRSMAEADKAAKEFVEMLGR